MDIAESSGAYESSSALIISIGIPKSRHIAFDSYVLKSEYRYTVSGNFTALLTATLRLTKQLINQFSGHVPRHQRLEVFYTFTGG